MDMKNNLINVTNMSKVFDYFGYKKLRNNDQLLLESGNSMWTAEAVEWLRNNNVTMHTNYQCANDSDIIIFEFETEEVFGRTDG
jgi:hypothetical protein